MTTHPSPAMKPPEDLLLAIQERRSLRAFATREVPEDAIERAFEAARWAPSGGNGQPWRFVLTRKGTPAFERLADALKPGNVWAREAPILFLAVTRTIHEHPDKPPRENHHALLDLGLALGQLFVQASADGLVTHAMGGIDREKSAAAVELNGPYEVAVIVAMGYPSTDPSASEEHAIKDERPRTRVPLGDMLFVDAFGGESLV